MAQPFSDQPLMELVYAMLLTSIGAAMIFNTAASAGGTDIIALIMKKFTKSSRLTPTPLLLSPPAARL